MANDGIVAGDDNGSASTRKRAEKTKRTFIDSDGNETPRANLKSVGGRIEFVKTGHTIDFAYEDLTTEVARAAALFGIMTSVTNTVGRADMSEQDMIEAAEARLDTIVKDGMWSAERQSGPANSDLIEAYARRNAKMGIAFTDQNRADVAAKLADEETGAAARQKLLSYDSVRIEFEAIKAERAAARLAKLKEKAAGKPADEGEIDL